jgi:hypothetical protein
MIDYTNTPTEHLQSIVILRRKYPQFNSPSDREECRAAEAELQRRAEPVPNPEVSGGTDFSYRLQKYGY